MAGQEGTTQRDQLRIRWVALRTLGRRARRLGDRVGGLTVYDIEGVRMVLPRGAHRFRRLVPCTHCGHEVVDHGHPVVNAADAARKPSVVLCEGCVRTKLSGR